ncbi:general substrate transporter [Papiliotrema laurentii]|uniref:General substrate transporter n=1 Tax=Papiliotrema laurentii TaxID=5418 RepID=A0AAD9FQZ2_PAPLA|nr:general substrate transporter [Papiliotrema laurentii]
MLIEKSDFRLQLLDAYPSTMGSSTLYLTTLLTALGFMLIGYDNGVMGGIIDNPPFKETFHNPSAGLVGTIVGIYEIGCFAGALITAVIGERLGRRRSIFLGAVVMLGGAGFQAGVSSAGAMIAARVVSGLGMGFINSTVPVLQAEVSPKKARGRFACFQLSLLNCGIFVAYWVGYGFTPMSGSKAWRIPVALQAVFIIPIIVLVFVVPESPRWLASHGRGNECLEVLARLQGKPTSHQDVMIQHKEIIDAVTLEQSIGSGTWADLLKEDEIKSRRRLLIACSIQFFQQIGGINAIIFYAGTFFSLVTDKAALMAGGLFTWFFVASFIPWMLIDTVGRRKLLLVCIAGMSAAFATESALVWKVQTSSSKAAAGAAVAVLFVYMGLFTIGFQAIVWVYPSEILPLRLRQKGSSISTACNWITNYIIVQIAPIGVKNIGWKFYIIFAVINAAFLPPIYFFYPETKGLSLEAVDLLFSQDHPTAFEEHKAEVDHAEMVPAKASAGSYDLDEKNV